nr:uncharacterized protein LOC111985117 [Quercus suber]
MPQQRLSHQKVNLATEIFIQRRKHEFQDCMKLRMSGMQRHSGMMFHLQRRTSFLLELSSMIIGPPVFQVTSRLGQVDHERFPSFPEDQPSTREMMRTENSIVERKGGSNHWGLSQIDQDLEAEEGEEEEEEAEVEEEEAEAVGKCILNLSVNGLSIHLIA